MNIYEQMGSRIKELRTNQKLTQEVIADKANLSVHFLSQIENGKRKASLDSIQKIAAALGVPVSMLFKQLRDGIPDFADKINALFSSYTNKEQHYFFENLKSFVNNYRSFKKK